MGGNSKPPSTIGVRNAFFSEVAIGISANTVLLLFHILTFLTEHRPKSTNPTIAHLAGTHTVMLITVGYMATGIFGSPSLWNDFNCKSLIYLYKLMRGLSICTTCRLSMLQAVILSPRSSCLAKFKRKSSRSNLASFLCLWVYNMAISSRFLLSTVATPNVTSGHLLLVTESCSLWPQNYFLRQIFFTLVAFQDITFLGLMAFSSGYMVLLLWRHKRQSTLHSNSTKPSSKASPEKRAMQSILLLVGLFVAMYCVDCAVSSPRTVWYSEPVRLYVQILMANGYAAISPLLLISTENRMITFFKSCWEGK